MRDGLWAGLAILGIALVLLIANHDSGSVAGVANSDFAHLVWLGLIGAVIAASLFASRIPVSAQMKQLATWAGIVVLLMGGYVYRYELQDFASRMTAGIVPGSPYSRTSEDGVLTVMIDRSRGHFQTVAEVNGKSLRFMIDTGASAVVLTPDAARAAGYDPDALSYTVRVNTANGTAQAAIIRLDAIDLGGIVRRDVEAMVAEPGKLDENLLGLTFLDTLSGYEVRGDRMIFRD